MSEHPVDGEPMGDDPKAPTGEQVGDARAHGKAKRPRSAAQLAQFEAMRAKRWANHTAEKARQAGVDTTGAAGSDPAPVRAGAPKLTTTSYQKPPKPPAGDPKASEPAPVDDPKPKPAASPRGGLLGLLADGLGL